MTACGLAFILTLAPGGTQAAPGTNPLDRVTSLLEAHGIRYETNALYDAAILGALRSIDPGARFLTTNEVQSMTETAAGHTGTIGVAFIEGFDQSDVLARAETWEFGIRYLRLNGVFQGAGDTVREAVMEPDRKALQSLILDLRGAGGTDHASVAAIAGLFAPATTNLFQLETMRGTVLVRHGTGEGPRLERPVIVLTDGETRQAAETLAAVLYRQPGVVLLGTRTAGDAYIREAVPFGPGRFIYLATRRMVPADGLDFDWSGVAPHIELAGEPESTPPVVPADEVDPPAFSLSLQESGTATVDVTLVSEVVDERSTTQKRRRERLMNRVSRDRTLERAVNILIGLRALGANERDASDDSKR